MKITKEQMKCLSKKIAKKINDNIDEENKKNAEETLNEVKPETKELLKEIDSLEKESIEYCKKVDEIHNKIQNIKRKIIDIEDITGYVHDIKESIKDKYYKKKYYIDSSDVYDSMIIKSIDCKDAEEIIKSFGINDIDIL